MEIIKAGRNGMLNLTKNFSVIGTLVGATIGVIFMLPILDIKQLGLFQLLRFLWWGITSGCPAGYCVGRCIDILTDHAEK